ncbi:hypothetical protein [Kineosporia sp. NBRC 101731]|uniref:hypothetical protein n=1 Tax=Kineosporia sp. NBRC 101731 TaxID=3032199 RepID=UPI0024A3F1DB|nr:hypothetical protein [Kineosporia sp. NBRC 101731]GLY32906.1 hypothetical protein Kisp02_62710 [Kineosporia sp. NBRC 101731]
MTLAPVWAMNSWHDGTYLGTYLIPTRVGWERWYDAQGALDVRKLPLALDAAPAVLHRLSDLPAHLRGLSLAGLNATDDDVRFIARRCRELRWIDLRGTHVTAAALDALAKIRTLQYIGVDPHLLLTRDPNRRPQLVAGSTALVPVTTGVPDPDIVGLHETLRKAVTKSPGSGAHDPDEAVARARVLLDAEQTEAALAVVATFLATQEPAVLIVAARCLLKLNLPLQALAALAPAPPTGAVLAWRSVVLTTLSPPEAARVAKAALRETFENQVAEWALVSAYLNRDQLVLAEEALNLLRSRTYDDIDEAKLSARLARARKKYADEAAAWHRLLTVVPDDADALAGLSRSQRCARPYSFRWMTTLNRAATADIGKYGRLMTVTLRGHRVSQSLGLSLLSWPVFLLLLSICGPFEHHVWGWSVAFTLLVGHLVTRFIWWRTPRDIRRTIRNSDRLTGERHGPSLRWLLISALIAAGAVLLIPANHAAFTSAPVHTPVRVTVSQVPLEPGTAQG